ncbi:hypothetical protein [Streptomyces sp. NRRL B-24720]|uniref:hypothetical protein n=1 Tax=Streptomyces sp. NRRL B-24720 TaxID=1476876 RepID=UPI0004C48053|nr:hypothetical protein [Streptomyces sp. NRRL B-24720]
MTITPAAELLAAAERAQQIGDPLHAALADWLDAAAKAHNATVIGAASVWRREHEAAERDAWVAQQTDQHALAVARKILGTTGSADTAAAPLLATETPLGHSTPSHHVLGWCSHCPGRSVPEELAAWQVDALGRALGRTDEMERLRAKNERMRHELEVMYGGAFDRLPTTPAATEEQPTSTCSHCEHPSDWHDEYEGCVGPNGIGGVGSGDCTCTRSPDQTTAPAATEEPTR